jgi:hypothetical protein
VGFSRVCRSDPFLDFIRETYAAVPLRLPDTRWHPLVLFSADRRSVRYLGPLPELPGCTATPPAIERSRLPTVAGRRTSSIKIGAAIKLLQPFLAAAFGSDLPVGSALTASADADATVSLSLGRATRSFVAPTRLAAWLDACRPQLPRTLRFGTGDAAGQATVYVVTDALLASDLEIAFTGGTSQRVGIELEAALVGMVGSDAARLTGAELRIGGRVDTPFAICCIPIVVDAVGTVVGVDVRGTTLRAAATDAYLPAPVEGAPVGGADELMAFDE